MRAKAFRLGSQAHSANESKLCGGFWYVQDFGKCSFLGHVVPAAGGSSMLQPRARHNMCHRLKLGHKSFRLSPILLARL